MDTVEISAGRLHLRPFVPADARAVFEACQDPDIARWTRVPSPYTQQDATTWVGQLAPRQWDTGSGAPFAVLDATSGELLASVGFVRFVREDALAEIGLWCAPGARRRGVGRDAVRAVCRWGFATQDLLRVEWLADVANTASQALAVRAGFTPEGVLRARLRGRSGQVDAWLGARVAGDPEAAGPGVR